VIRDALEVVSEATMDRAADLVVAALVGGPVRSVLAGVALLAAIGHWIDGWLVAAIAAAGIGDAIRCATRLPRRWRPW